MKKVILRLTCGTGMDSTDAFLVTQEEWNLYQSPGNKDPLGQYAWEEAVQFAESYGIYPTSDMPEDYDEDDGDEYSDDIDGWFEEYDPEEHDGLMVGTQKEWEWRTL